MTTANPHRLSDALRACARGILTAEAGVSLLTGSGRWLHREDFTSQFIVTATSISDPHHPHGQHRLARCDRRPR